MEVTASPACSRPDRHLFSASLDARPRTPHCPTRPMLGIGLIGLGKHGSRYARHIVEDLTDAALVAVCRRNRPEGERLAAAYRCTFHDDYRDLVANPGVDAVVAAVPPDPPPRHPGCRRRRRQ